MNADVTNERSLLMPPSDNDVTNALFSGKSAYVRRLAATSVKTLNDAEKVAILSDLDKSKRFSWALSSAACLSRLRKGAYSVTAFADDDASRARDSLELRDWAARNLACQPTTATGRAQPRNYFIVWRVFQEKRHARHIYLPATTVIRSAQSMGVCDTDEVAKCVLRGPPDSGVVTHTEYGKMQASIRNFLKNASVIDPACARNIARGPLDEHQMDTARKIMDTPFSVLHGGAGTGKSTLIAAIVNAFIAKRVPVVCLAPTHRAKKNLAKRLPPSTNVVTVDSFIKSCTASGGGGAHGSFIFVDEASMIDLEKLAKLARTVVAGSTIWQVCLTGDDGQLEPIDRGEMFRTMIQNAGPHVFQLQKCYRADNTSLLDAQNAIRDGRMPDASSSPSVRVTLHASDGAVERTLEPYIQEHQNTVQYIAWTNRMCDFVNSHVQKNVRGGDAPSGNMRGTPVTGDRVVYIGQNDVRKGLTNAMLGTVTATAPAQGPLKVRWDDTESVIACARSDLILAYCVTVHRAQGSQYEHVCVIATGVPAMMRALDRRWAYTAVSRAQRKCDIMSTNDFPEFVRRSVRKREMVGINFNFASKA